MIIIISDEAQGQGDEAKEGGSSCQGAQDDEAQGHEEDKGGEACCSSSRGTIGICRIRRNREEAFRLDRAVAPRKNINSWTLQGELLLLNLIFGLIYALPHPP